AEFPIIGESPYFLTLSPHAALWFSLEPSVAREASLQQQTEDALLFERDWKEILSGDLRPRTETFLWSYLKRAPWFDGKTRKVKGVQIQDAIAVPVGSVDDFLLILSVEYVEGDPARYLLPVSHS